MIHAQVASRSAVLLRFPVRILPSADVFTLEDLMVLQCWSRRAAFAGYGRMVIEPSRPGPGPDRAAYALIYIRDDPWSRWGLSRGEDGITVWCSRTFADHGTFATMEAALASMETDA